MFKNIRAKIPRDPYLGVYVLTIVPKRRKRKARAVDDIKRGVALFMVFLGLSLVVHETFHLVVARVLGYEAEIFYGIDFPNVYGVVHITPSSLGAIDTILIFSAGGLGAGAVFYILWFAIEDIVAKLMLSFFTLMQVAYGILEPMYGLGLLQKAWLSTIPIVVGMVTLIIFRIIYWRLGWW